MALQVGALTGAAHGEKRPPRPAWRIVYREREPETRAGTAELPIPKLRKGFRFLDGNVGRGPAALRLLCNLRSALRASRAFPQKISELRHRPHA